MGAYETYAISHAYSILEQDDSKQGTDINKIMLYYTVWLFSAYLVVLMSDLIIVSSAIRSSRKLHKEIVNSLLKASFPKFYNKAMTGRIMNRLSNDILLIDRQLPVQIQYLFDNTFITMGYIGQFIVAQAWSLIPPIVFYIMLYCYLVYIYMRTMREMTRIEAISKSPILILYSQIVRGAVYIRTCVKRSFIGKLFTQVVDKNVQNQIISISLFSWFLNWQYQIGCLIFCMMFVVLLLQGEDADTSSYMMNVGMGLASSFMGIALALTQSEIYMINFERCFALSKNIEIEEETQQNRTEILNNLSAISPHAINANHVALPIQDQPLSSAQAIDPGDVKVQLTDMKALAKSGKKSEQPIYDLHLKDQLPIR